MTPSYSNHDMTYVMNMNAVLCMFVTLSVTYEIFNANMTLFEMSLL